MVAPSFIFCDERDGREDTREDRYVLADERGTPDFALVVSFNDLETLVAVEGRRLNIRDK